MSFDVLSYSDVQRLDDPDWLIDNTIPIGPGGSFGVVFGKPGCGKSFLVNDMACCIGTGIPWHGRSVEEGHTLYFAAEGKLGFKARTRAWCKHHEFKRLPKSFFIFDSLDLMDLRQVDKFVEAAHELPDTPRLVVIDTLARSMRGDENETKDMGMAVLGAQRIQTLNCAVILVHHIGYAEDQDRPRGNSALVGAADFMIKVEKHQSTMKVSCTKQKDGEEFIPFHLTMTSCAGSVVLTRNDGSRTPLRRVA